jgi:hypothetical protein
MRDIPDIDLKRVDIRADQPRRSEAFSALPAMRCSANFGSITVSLISLRAVCKSGRRQPPT